MMVDSGPLRINKSLSLNPGEIEISYIHASGPGGQNVNKVASAAQFRFSVRTSRSLPTEVKERLYNIAGNKITRDGDLVITARRYRSQARNRDDAIKRLLALLARATRKPTPRIATRPSRAARRRRVDQKTRRGRVKADRRRPGESD